MTDIRTIAALMRAAGAGGADMASIAASLPLPPLRTCAALARPFTVAAFVGKQLDPFAGRVFVPGFNSTEE